MNIPVDTAADIPVDAVVDIPVDIVCTGPAGLSTIIGGFTLIAAFLALIVAIEAASR